MIRFFYLEKMRNFHILKCTHFEHYSQIRCVYKKFILLNGKKYKTYFIYKLLLNNIILKLACSMQYDFYQTNVQK